MTLRLALAVFLAAACGHQQENTMPQTYTGAPGTLGPDEPVDITVPLGGDAPNAASAVTPLCQLADRVALIMAGLGTGVKIAPSIQNGFTVTDAGVHYEWADLIAGGVQENNPGSEVEHYAGCVEAGSQIGRMKVTRAGKYRVRAKVRLGVAGAGTAGPAGSLDVDVDWIEPGFWHGRYEVTLKSVALAASTGQFDIDNIFTLAADSEVAVKFRAYKDPVGQPFLIYPTLFMLSVDWIGP